MAKKGHTPAPVKLEAPTKSVVVGDIFRIFGAINKSNIDTESLEKNYTKVTYGLDQISKMMKLMKSLGVNPDEFEIYLPKDEGLLVALSEVRDTVYLCSPRIDPIDRLKIKQGG